MKHSIQHLLKIVILTVGHMKQICKGVYEYIESDLLSFFCLSRNSINNRICIKHGPTLMILSTKIFRETFIRKNPLVNKLMACLERVQWSYQKRERRGGGAVTFLCFEASRM